MMPLQSIDPAPTEATGHALVRALHCAGLTRQDLILVAGRGGFAAMLWLCRQGYERAQHLAGERQAYGAEPADALLVPHLCQTDDLKALLTAGGHIREGGALILRTGARFEPVEAIARSATLYGYALEGRLSEGGHALYIARRRAELLPARKVA